VGEISQNQSDATDGSGFRDLTGREIGRYHIQKRLGRGGLTTVYQAYDIVDGIPVALKVLLHSTDEKVYNRFRYEAQTAAKLHHPHIVRTLRVGMASGNDSAYIAMELVEGEDLSALLSTRRRLTAEESSLLLAPIAEALAYAHKRGVIHRDVKPSNILLRTVSADAPNSVVLESLDYPLVPLLSDFGIARALDVPELTHSGRTVGTPAFMAPEQCLGRRNIDHRADIYALGAVFYRCITGRQPFVGSTVQILHAHIYEPVTIDDEILRQLSQAHLQILQRSLAKDPTDRYQSADEMAADLALGGNLLEVGLSAEQLEHNTTMTLDLVVLNKTAVTAGRTSVLIPATTDLAVPPSTTTTATAPSVPAVTTAAPAPKEPDVYYDRALDQRLQRISGIILAVLLVLIGFLLFLQMMNLSLRDLWQGFKNTWQPLPSVMAASSELDGTMPMVASGNGQGRQAAGVVAQLPSPALEDKPVAVIWSTTPLTATAKPAPTTCTFLPHQALKAYIAQLAPKWQPEFQCATSAVMGGTGELLKFEHGFMLYLAEVNRMFVFNVADQQWEDLDLTWLTDTPIAPLGAINLPEEGRFTPQRIFGTIWQDAEIQRLLGLAIMPEAARFPVRAQKFPGGWLVIDLERHTDPYLFLRSQRRW
jgi:serine/threonine-protein kinase